MEFQWQKLWSWVTILMLSQKGQKREGYHLGDASIATSSWGPLHPVDGRLALAGAFLGTLLVLTSPVCATTLLFTSGINTALYPIHIPDLTCIVFSSVGLCLVD